MGNAEIRSPADGEWHSSVHAARPTMIVGREVRDIDNGASQSGAERCDRYGITKIAWYRLCSKSAMHPIHQFGNRNAVLLTAVGSVTKAKIRIRLA
jgi:hypothetical protein